MIEGANLATTPKNEDKGIKKKKNINAANKGPTKKKQYKEIKGCFF